MKKEDTYRTRTVLLGIHLPLFPCTHRLYLSQWGFLCYHLYPFNYIQRIFTALHPIHPLGPVFYFDFIYTPSADNSFFSFCFFCFFSFMQQPSVKPCTILLSFESILITTHMYHMHSDSISFENHGKVFPPNILHSFFNGSTQSTNHLSLYLSAPLESILMYHMYTESSLLKSTAQYSHLTSFMRL